jgi:HK97 gp10 family phage protein
MAYQRFEELVRAIFDDLVNIKKKVILQAAQYARADVLKIFKTEGRSHDVKWHELNEDYLKSKVCKGFSEKKLHRTTTLKQSINVTDNVDHAIVGTPVFYGLFHEEGTKKMPARPFVKPAFESMQTKVEDIAAAVFRGY